MASLLLVLLSAGFDLSSGYRNCDADVEEAMTHEIFLRGLVVTASVALLLAILPWFHPSCQPFHKRFGWFFIRYAVPAYCLMLIGELLFLPKR